MEGRVLTAFFQEYTLVTTYAPTELLNQDADKTARRSREREQFVQNLTTHVDALRHVNPNDLSGAGVPVAGSEQRPKHEQPVIVASSEHTQPVILTG